MAQEEVNRIAQPRVERFYAALALKGLEAQAVRDGQSRHALVDSPDPLTLCPAFGLLLGIENFRSPLPLMRTSTMKRVLRDAGDTVES